MRREKTKKNLLPGLSPSSLANSLQRQSPNPCRFIPASQQYLFFCGVVVLSESLHFLEMSHLAVFRALFRVLLVATRGSKTDSEFWSQAAHLQVGSRSIVSSHSKNPAPNISQYWNSPSCLLLFVTAESLHRSLQGHHEPAGANHSSHAATPVREMPLTTSFFAEVSLFTLSGASICASDSSEV